MQLLASEFSADYYTHCPGIVNILMLTIRYTLAMALRIHTQGMFTNHTTHSLYRIVVMATSVVGVMKMGNIAPRMGLKSTSLAFRASGLPLHHKGCLMSELYAHLSVYAAHCLRGQLSWRDLFQITIPEVGIALQSRSLGWLLTHFRKEPFT